MEILQKVSQWLERVEDQVAASLQQAARASVGSPSGPGKLSTDNVLVSSNKPSKKSKKFRFPLVSTDWSSESSDSNTPSLGTIRSYSLQKKVDQIIRKLDHSSHLSGGCRGFVKISFNKNHLKEKVSWFPT